MAQGDAAPRYSAFISYCHRNKDTARWLHRALETYRVPSALVGTKGEYGPVPRKVGRVFRDEEELPGAAELGPKLQGALQDSAALIVVCSTEAVGSKWVDEEIRFFRRTHPERPVLAVIANGAPGGTQECFPESLRYGVGELGELDRNQVHEPLAPDLQKLDKHSVKLKLIAGLFGIGYGELTRRDVKRVHRQMALMGSLGAAVIAALTVLSVLSVTYADVAVKQRNEARRQRSIAEHNAQEAERKAWLANEAAKVVREQATVLEQGKGGAICTKTRLASAPVV